MTAEDLKEKIKGQLHLAIKQFGEYSFFDKGPDEVMLIGPIICDLEQLPLDQISKVLSGILDDEKEYGQQLVATLITSLDHRPDFADLFEMDNRFEY